MLQFQSIFTLKHPDSNILQDHNPPIPKLTIGERYTILVEQYHAQVSKKKKGTNLSIMRLFIHNLQSTLAHTYQPMLIQIA